MDLAVQRVFIEDHTPWEEPAIQAGYAWGGSNKIINELKEMPTPKNLDDLLAQYPNFQLHQGDVNGCTVLQVAIEKDALPLVRHILTLRPDLVNAYWNHQVIPQIFSATKSWAIFSEFIKRGANIHARNRSLDTVLDAATYAQPNMSVIKYLLRSGAVTNELRRQSILDPHNSWPEIERDITRNQPAVVRRGLEQILGEDLFLQGHFPLHVTKETTVELPLVARELIWRFMTNFWDAPSLENRVLFPLLESEARKMMLIEKLAAKKIGRLCGELMILTEKVRGIVVKDVVDSIDHFCCQELEAWSEEPEEAWYPEFKTWYPGVQDL